MKKVFTFLFLYILAYADVKEEKASEWVKEGFLYYQKGDFSSAIACYKKALYIEPNFASAWYWYGNTLFRYGMEDMAKLCYERYIKLVDDPYIKDKIERYWGERKEEYSHIFTIEGDVKDTSRFSLPFGIYIDRLNNLYVAGFGNDVILKFSPFGKEILRIKHENLKKPFGVCVDNEGNIYVTSYANHCVLKFSPFGKLLLMFGKKGIKDGHFISPKGITIDALGNIYVVDQTRMQKFSKEGKFIGKIDNLISPHNVCLDNGYIFICEGSSVKKFDSSFNYISEVKISGKWSFIYKNNLYISTDAGISVYSQDLKPIKKIELPFPFYSFSFNRFGFLYTSSPTLSKIYAFSNLSNIDLIVNRIDLINYPIVIFGLALYGDKNEITGLSSDNVRILEENRYIYALGLEEIKERLGLVFVIEDSKYIKKKEAKKLLSSLVKQFKDGVSGASVISFSDTSEILSEFTLNKTKMRDAIDSLSFKEDIIKEEAFLSGLNKGITFGRQFLSKKAIVVLTSIKCKNETEEMKRLANYAKNNGVPIFIIDYKKDKDLILERLCKVSGGDYLLARNSKELHNLYNFIKERLSTQAQYIVYYYSENAAIKWKNEWVSLRLEVGKGKFGICEELFYLVPSVGGAYSSLGKTLIEERLSREREEKIKIMKKEREKIRKEIRKKLKAEEEAKKKKREKEEKH